MDSVPRKEMTVVLQRWLGDAEHVGGLGSNSYGGGLAWVGLENHGIDFVDGAGVA